MDRENQLRHFLEKYAGTRVLPEQAVKEFLREAGLPSPRSLYLPVGTPFPEFSGLGYPLVAKVFSAKIRSKTDVGGIRFGLKDAAAAAAACSDLMKIQDVEGVILEEQASPGTEVIVGGIVDPQFGPVVMFGLGGIFVELFQDVAFALAPLTRYDAFQLMAQLKGYRLLTGYRGAAPCDLESLADILVAVSELMATGLLEELDLNPVALYPDGAMILDAKMLVALSSPSVSFR
ncbi:MAG: acyl-CoA synthetase [Deltaproteobacteria bacterium]|nr:acyl-CoA synthetase [Deltaproteobacteria bacterium]TLN04069.1 MAG: acyl-CoA synthetase [bacterium]